MSDFRPCAYGLIEAMRVIFDRLFYEVVINDITGDDDNSHGKYRKFYF